MRERSRDEESEELLRSHLPVTAVDENDERRALARVEEINAIAWRRPIFLVERARVLIAHASTSFLPACDDLRAVLYRGTVVVRSIQLRPVHSPVERHLRA